jgi:uncharacterized protein
MRPTIDTEEEPAMQPVPFDTCRWLNEPPEWSAKGDRLDVVTGGKTDFWRGTHYGFVRDTGHFLGHRVSGDRAAQIRFRAKYSALYDQAGLMVRIDERNWIKAGIEFTDGQHALSTVATFGNSDWSVGALPGLADEVHLRLTIAKGALRVQASADGEHWPLFRLLPFPDCRSYEIGPMCCTPERAGLEVHFEDFLMGAPLAKDLHDLS